MFQRRLDAVEQCQIALILRLHGHAYSLTVAHLLGLTLLFTAVILHTVPWVTAT